MPKLTGFNPGEPPALYQHQELGLLRCPYCKVAKPRLSFAWDLCTTDHSQLYARYWRGYLCNTCGGIVLTASAGSGPGYIMEIYPETQVVDETIPGRARTFLTQAVDSLHAPAGAIMLAASSVDAMLKEKDYKDGSLHARIKKAAEDHLITSDMADWANEIRLDANDQRHADEAVELPNQNDAKRVIEFALALGEFLFVLPFRVTRGRQAAGSGDLGKEEATNTG